MLEEIDIDIEPSDDDAAPDAAGYGFSLVTAGGASALGSTFLPDPPAANEEAAVVSGIPVNRVLILTFGIMGFITALGGFMQTAYAGTSTMTIGQLVELDAIAACVIGGASLKGGRGTVVGVLFGSLIMASLLNGMNLLAYDPEVKFIVRGSVLALAVWMDIRLSRK